MKSECWHLSLKCFQGIGTILVRSKMCLPSNLFTSFLDIQSVDNLFISDATCSNDIKKILELKLVLRSIHSTFCLIAKTVIKRLYWSWHAIVSHKWRVPKWQTDFPFAIENKTNKTNHYFANFSLPNADSPHKY